MKPGRVSGFFISYDQATPVREKLSGKRANLITSSLFSLV